MKSASKRTGATTPHGADPREPDPPKEPEIPQAPPERVEPGPSGPEIPVPEQPMIEPLPESPIPPPDPMLRTSIEWRSPQNMKSRR